MTFILLIKRVVNDSADLVRALIFSRWLVISCSLLTLSAIGFWQISAVKAQEPNDSGTFRANNLEMSVRAGFGRLEVSNWMGSWVPFRITISNQGPPVTGRLIVHCESSANPTIQVREYVKEVQLPTGSRQLHEIAAYLNSSQSPIIRLVSGDDVIAETSVRVERTYGLSDQLEVGVIDTDSTALNNITATEVIRSANRGPFRTAALSLPPPLTEPESLPSIVNATPSQAGPPRRRSGSSSLGKPVFQAHPIVIAPEDIPIDSISLDLFDAVVIGDAPLNQLSPEQTRALRLWVGSGGLLIFTGAADVPGLARIGLEPINPVNPVGTVSTGTLPDLTAVYGLIDASDRLSFLSSTLKPESRMLLGSTAQPLVAEKNYGSGLVRFVAFNPKLNPYRSWSASKDLWIDLLLPAAEAKPKHSNWITTGRGRGTASNRWGVQGFLFHLAEIAPPSPRYVLLFLLAYVLTLGPINYAVLRWKRKTDLAWLTIPAVVVAFSAVSVVVAQIGRGGSSVVSDASLVEVHQQDGLMRSTGGLLVMPASKRTHEITLAGRDSYANDLYNGNQSSSASAIGDIECERSADHFILKVPMNPWTSGLFQIRSITEGSDPILSSVAGPSGAMLKNLGDSRIARAVFLSSDGVSDVFDLEPLGEQRISLSVPPSSSFNTWYLSKLGQDTDEEELYQEISTQLDREIGGEAAFAQGFFEKQNIAEAIKQLRRPIVVGFIDKGPSLSFQGSLKRKSKALYVIHL